MQKIDMQAPIEIATSVLKVRRRWIGDLEWTSFAPSRARHQAWSSGLGGAPPYPKAQF